MNEKKKKKEEEEEEEKKEIFPNPPGLFLLLQPFSSGKKIMLL